MAPDSFLDLLPAAPLDGELWAGRGNFQLCRSICGGDSPDPRFSLISFAVYGFPPIDTVIQTGEIKNANFHCLFDEESIQKFVAFCAENVSPNFQTLDAGATFDHELMAGAQLLSGDRVFVHKQVRLPDDEAAAVAQIEVELGKVLELGGEGVMLRSPGAAWTPKRVSTLLKYKPFNDDEGVLVGFTTGRETDKGSRLRGKIGALILDYKGKRLELSGLTDEEREFCCYNDTTYAHEHPGEEMPRDVRASRKFKLGQKITFIFRELTDDGIPKEARYLRQREDEE